MVLRRLQNLPKLLSICEQLCRSILTNVGDKTKPWNIIESYSVHSVPLSPYKGLVVKIEVVINPRRACAARVTVLGLSVSQSVCVSVYDYSRTAGNEAASERYQQLQRNKRSKIKLAILLIRRRSRSRNWHYRGPRCVTH